MHLVRLFTVIRGMSGGTVIRGMSADTVIREMSGDTGLELQGLD